MNLINWSDFLPLIKILKKRWSETVVGFLPLDWLRSWKTDCLATVDSGKKKLVYTRVVRQILRPAILHVYYLRNANFPLYLSCDFTVSFYCILNILSSIL